MYTPARKGYENPELGNSRNHHQKCVCEICTCGKHACPEPSAKFEGETTHNHYYKPYSINAEQPPRLDYQPGQKHYDPNLLKSTYDSTYTPHQIQREQLPPRADYQPSRGRFEDETEYKKSYVPSQIQVERPYSPLKYVPNTTKFEGSTTYNREYSPKRMEYSSSRVNYDYQPNKVPFEGQTTYDREYKAHKIEAQYPDSSNRYVPNNTKFAGQSHYNEVPPSPFRSTSPTLWNPSTAAPPNTCPRCPDAAPPARNTSTTAPRPTDGSDLFYHPLPTSAQSKADQSQS